MRIILIISTILIFFGANFYVFYRLWRLMPPTVIGRILLVTAGIILAGSVFLYFTLVTRDAPHWLMTTIHRIGTSWVMIFVYVLMAFLLLELLRLTGLVPMEWFKTGSWTAFGIFAGVITVTMAAGNIVYHNKKRAEVEVAVAKDTGGNSLKIIAVSDLHLGYGIGMKEFMRWVDMINAEEPDVVVMAGDVIDTHVKPLYWHNMADAFRALKPRYGIYLALGNHEYISGAEECVKFFESAGVNVLRDSSVLIGDTAYIVGRDDISNRNRKPLARLIEDIDTSKPVIVLDHQPSDLNEAMHAGADFQFSGHTHYGQVWPISWITNAIFETAYGPHTKGDTQYYVSSGLGIWGGKYRIGSRSEYVVINLMQKQ